MVARRQTHKTAHTSTYDKIIYEPVIKCIISDETMDGPVRKEVKALLDTGATVGGISETLANDCELTISRYGTMHHGGITIECNPVYKANLILDGHTYPRVEFDQCEMKTDAYDIIIGTNFLSHFDFAMTHTDGQTKISLGHPSIHDIDFVRDAELIIGAKS